MSIEYATNEDTSQLGKFAVDWYLWHLDQDTQRADPHGFLAVTSLNWLTEQPRRFLDAPGSWSTGADGVQVCLGDGEELLVGGAPVRGRYSFGAIPERGSINASWQDAVIEVARRGGRDLVRPRHPGNPRRTAFGGTPAYPPDPRWVVTGRYLQFAERQPTRVGAVIEGLTHVYDAPGRVEFELFGDEFSLTAFPGHRPSTLLLLFTDATSGVTTYGASRALWLEPPRADGTLTIDFNRAVNLPCAYTDLATCPLPPRENRLPVAIRAGEMTPYERSANPPL